MDICLPHSDVQIVGVRSKEVSLYQSTMYTCSQYTPVHNRHLSVTTILPDHNTMSHMTNAYTKQ